MSMDDPKSTNVAVADTDMSEATADDRELALGLFCCCSNNSFMSNKIRHMFSVLCCTCTIFI